MNQFTNRTYDLAERTSKFGEEIIDFCKSIKQDNISSPLVNQLVRSGTSIGANYMEANCASSEKDFNNKIYICKKEAQETKHWLRMIARYFSQTDKVKALWQECHELNLIFQKITQSLKEKSLKIKR